MTFDVNQFENATHEKAMDSTYTPIPAGEYTGQIGVEQGDLKIETGTSAKTGRAWARLDTWVYLNDPSGKLKESHGDRPRYRLSTMLDLTDDSTEDRPTLATGANRNLDLGRLQEATGNNQPGWKFSGFRGRSLRLKLGIGPRKDKPEIMENKVEALSAA